MPIEQIAVLQILAEHGEAFVSSQAPELNGVGAALHAASERAALQAVPAEVIRREARLGGAELDDAGDGPRR